MPLTPAQIEIMKQQPGPPGGTYAGPPGPDEAPDAINENVDSQYGVIDPRGVTDYENIDYAKLEAWLKENVYSKGYSEDPATGAIYDKQGKIIGQVPTFYKTN